MLDMCDIKVSVGSACNAHSYEPSHVLKAIGLTDEQAMRSVRFTLSEDITYQEIDKVINEIDKAIKIIKTN
jgi:cysteine desulfurase